MLRLRIIIDWSSTLLTEAESLNQMQISLKWLVLVTILFLGYLVAAYEACITD